MSAADDLAVLVPVKDFGVAKRRLADALGPAARSALSRRLATGVVAAAAGIPVTIVCDDDEVAAWAETVGAAVLWTPGQGLNGAVQAGVDALAVAGAARILVAHGDLALPHGLLRLAESPTGAVALVPDRLEDGTNVLLVPTGHGFRFAYGPGSFRRHVAEAERCGLVAHVVRDPDLALDVDLPEHLVSVPDLPGSSS